MGDMVIPFVKTLKAIAQVRDLAKVKGHQPSQINKNNKGDRAFR
jgi:hypothetical protein